MAQQRDGEPQEFNVRPRAQPTTLDQYALINPLKRYLSS